MAEGGKRVPRLWPVLVLKVHSAAGAKLCCCSHAPQPGARARLSHMLRYCNGPQLAVNSSFIDRRRRPSALCCPSPRQVREERRLFFVGLTRAKQRLVLVHALEQTIWGDASR